MHKDLPRETQKKDYDPSEDARLSLGSESVCSTTECTGLIQTEIAAPSEVESYQEIYDIPLKKKGPGVRNNRHTDDGRDQDGFSR